MSKIEEYSTRIVITDQFEGIHCWPDAHEKVPDVGFLSDPHRHIFKIRIELNVTHTDRDVEFIRFKRNIQGHLLEKFSINGNGVLELGSMSCEDLGQYLIGFLSNDYDVHRVEVWEDGENGAIIERIK